VTDPVTVILKNERRKIVLSSSTVKRFFMAQPRAGDADGTRLAIFYWKKGG
jgi:hypothetical protein